MKAMTSPDPQDSALIRQAQAGDDEAFEQLVERYTAGLYRVVRRFASDSAEAEALVQEAFLRAWRALPRYRDDGPFFPYLVTIAANLGRDAWRKARRLDFGGLEPLEDTLPGEDADLEGLVEQEQTLQLLAQAVAGLPPAYRLVIALYYDAGLSYEEIGQALSLPVNTVRTHLRRAKAHLRQHLESQEVAYG